MDARSWKLVAMVLFGLLLFVVMDAYYLPWRSQVFFDSLQQERVISQQADNALNTRLARLEKVTAP